MLTPPRRLSWPERLSGILWPRGAERRPAPRAGFLRDLASPFFFGWKPVMRDPFYEYRKAYYDVGARAIDAIQNSGWLAGGIEQAATQMCGPMLGLNARPDPLLFGSSIGEANRWARAVETRFNAWARSAYACDFTSNQSLGQLCSQAVKSWFAYGEIVAIVQYKRLPGNEHGTKIQLLPPTRIPQVAQSDSNAVQGISIDRDGRALAYYFTVPNLHVLGIVGEIRVPARDETGRRIVVHIHDSPPAVLRGITPLAPALQVVRQFDQLSNATLTAALIQAIFAATVESDAPTEQVLAALQNADEQDATAGGFDAFMGAKTAWYENSRIDLGQFGKVVHLFMGEKLNFHASEQPNDNYQAFARFLLLEIARCLGITYEQLTGDWREATYTSGRMGAAENWLTNLYRRNVIAGPFMQSAYEAWLEEDIELGGTPFPGGVEAFIAQRTLACAADWRGPPKPTADDYKTAKANETKLANKVISREMWSAEEGVDYDDVFQQLAQEQDRADELGIDLNPLPPGKGGKVVPDQAPNAEDQGDQQQ